MASNRLSILQKQFWLRNTTGVSDATPAGQLQRVYMMQYIIAHEAGVVPSQVHKSTLNELKIRWIKCWIVTNGGTPQPNTYNSSQWKTAVTKLGIISSKSMSENMMKFYLNTLS